MKFYHSVNILSELKGVISKDVLIMRLFTSSVDDSVFGKYLNSFGGE